MATSGSNRVHAHLSVSGEAAQDLLTAGLEAATAAGVPSAIAVVDRAGTLIAFGRQDAAPLVAGPYAIKKAVTVARVGQPTQGLWDFVSTDPAMLTGIAQDQDLLVLGGGVPLTIDGQLVGAVGASGGSYTQDDEIAQATAAAFGA